MAEVLGLRVSALQKSTKCILPKDGEIAHSRNLHIDTPQTNMSVAARTRTSLQSSEITLSVCSVVDECGLHPANGRCKNMFLKSKKGDFFAFSCQVCVLKGHQSLVCAPPSGNMRQGSEQQASSTCLYLFDTFLKA